MSEGGLREKRKLNYLLTLFDNIYNVYRLTIQRSIYEINNKK